MKAEWGDTELKRYNPAQTILLGFEDCVQPARRLADHLGVHFEQVNVHVFPDGERRLRLPGSLPTQVIVYRSLHDPDHKLLELMLTAQSARAQGVQQLSLVCPYLCYMRQDKAFEDGEVVSQTIIGRHLAHLFDEVITVDPHLHRVSKLDDAVPAARALAVSASDLLGKFLARQLESVLLVGPDAESEQWVSAIAQASGFDACVASKQRHGDHEVSIELPDEDYRERSIVLVDDVLSTGQTLAVAARQARQRGAARIFAAVTHALFANHAAQALASEGIERIWSTDSIVHPSNAVFLAPLLAEAVSTRNDTA